MVSGFGLSDSLKRLILILDSLSVLSLWFYYFGVSSSWCIASLAIAIIMEIATLLMDHSPRS